MYLNGKRDDLAKKEENEIRIISKFLPEQLSTKEIEIVINEIITSSSTNSVRDIGKIINLMKEKYDGKIDFGVASKMIKEKLS